MDGWMELGYFKGEWERKNEEKNEKRFECGRREGFDEWINE